MATSLGVTSLQMQGQGSGSDIAKTRDKSKAAIGLPRLPEGYQVDPPDDPDSPALSPRMWDKIPEKADKSFLDDINEKIVDPAVGKIADRLDLSKEHRRKLKKLAEEAIEKGISKGLDAALGQIGVKGPEKEALEKIVEAGIKYKDDHQRGE